MIYTVEYCARCMTELGKTTELINGKCPYRRRHMADDARARKPGPILLGNYVLPQKPKAEGRE